ncbi:MAG TPA: ORF6N domain-containing protein [Candidatus Onthousia faecipullorum]|uniref:ORF6N domain-containing protein n=1 Tax=Candidatus Onthousia faecipullorum TaxID=2840887 RepID=A0A9D1GCC7_9FIRM|nr:ORF6N domain-containing protein [Candidatus Onthousia faecipullorum]
MNEVVTNEDIKIENMIYEIRGKQVMLDSDLARLYKCKNGTKTINLAVKRHINRFPERFMFQLTKDEYDYLRFQTETAKENNMSRTLPYVFTEQGVAMLATVLNTKVATEVSIRIMDAFISMRKSISSNLLEQKYINDLALEHDKRIKALENLTNKIKKIEED